MAQPLTSQIEHVVVVMMENRSFDNVLGGLYPQLTKRGLYRGLLGTESNPLNPANPSQGSVSVFQGGTGLSTWITPYPDPGELYTDMVQQIFGSASSSGSPKMNGFAWNYGAQPDAPAGDGWPVTAPVPQDIMQYYSHQTMPWSWYLAQQYAVCDGWYASGPVQTLANRIFAHCGTPTKIPNTNLSRINNPDYTDKLTVPFVPPVTDTTIFELLDKQYPGGRAGVCSDLHPGQQKLNWKVYYNDAPLSALCKYVYDRWCYDYFFGGNVYSFTEHGSSQTNFEYDIQSGQLPKYSFIEPCYSDFFGGTANSNHPGGAGIDFNNYNGDSLPPPISVVDGEIFVGQIYNILASYPDVFAKTLLIITYDEHGGTYDHVAPPPAVSPFPQAVTNFNYNRYGVRVPAIFIHPWIKPGTIYPGLRAGAAPQHYDHTSLLSTLTAQFNLGAPLTPRSAAAPMLVDLIPPGPVSHARPAPPQHPLAGHTPAPSPKRPPITNVPVNARTLAGALGSLYHVETQRRHKRSAQKRP